MAIAESRKRANAKWDKENMTTLGCKIKREQASAFKAYCENRGSTSNTVLKKFVLDCIGEQKPETIPRALQDGAGRLAGVRGISISHDTLEAAERGAERTGEAPAAFIARAVESQVERDDISLHMGINPVTGNKRERENQEADGGD